MWNKELFCLLKWLKKIYVTFLHKANIQLNVDNKTKSRWSEMNINQNQDESQEDCHRTSLSIGARDCDHVKSCWNEEIYK